MTQNNLFIFYLIIANILHKTYKSHWRKKPNTLSTISKAPFHHSRCYLDTWGIRIRAAMYTQNNWKLYPKMSNPYNTLQYILLQYPFPLMSNFNTTSDIIRPMTSSELWHHTYWFPWLPCSHIVATSQRINFLFNWLKEEGRVFRAV
jgi:hypothetical protein